MSSVWNYYRKDIEKKVSICNICGNQLKFSGSTSSMWHHLRSKHASSIKNYQPSPSPSTSSSGGLESYFVETSTESSSEIDTKFSDLVTTSESTKRPHDDDSTSTSKAKQVKLTNIFRTSSASKQRNELITRNLTQMIAQDMLPVSMVEGAGFKKFMNFLEPSYVIPSRGTITSRFNLLYDIEKEKIIERISKLDHVSLTTDCWTARNNDSYITVTLHGINQNWTMENYTLTTSGMHRHTSENLSEKLKETIDEWQLEKKVVATVHDNAANIVKAVEESIFCGESVRCFAHTLQLSINGAFDKIDEIKYLIEKCSSVVGHFNHSSIASKSLTEMQEKLQLPKHKLMQHVKTRWNSVYYMMERLEEQRTALLATLNDRSVTKRQHADQYTFSENQWEIISHLVKVLKPFELATKVISGENYPTLSICQPLIKSFIDNFLVISATDIECIKDFKNKIVEDLKRRFHFEDTMTNRHEKLSVFDFATFLDPRYKTKERKMGLNKKIIVALNSQLTALKELSSQDNSSVIPSSDNLVVTSAIQLLFPEEADRINNKSEVACYYDENVVPKNVDILEWWRNKEKEYPWLAKLANKYLCIPVTSTPSERVFSAAGNIVSAKRNCLNMLNVDKLIFLHNNLK